MKIGARTLKTGLVVTLTLFLVHLLETKIGTWEYNIAGMATITAIIGMQPSIKGSLQTFRNRVVATFIGCLIAFLLALTWDLNPLSLGLGSIIIILICLHAGLDESIRFALITLVAVGTYHYDFNLSAVLYRVTGMLIGLIVSTGLNIIFIPPDYTQDLKEKINSLRLKFEDLYGLAISDLLREGKIAKEIMKAKRQIIREELEETRKIYSLLLDDVGFTDQKGLKKYRRAINALQTNLERLMNIHHCIVFLPDEPHYFQLRQDLYQYLLSLLELHRQIYARLILKQESEIKVKEINETELRNKIVRLIKAEPSEPNFEFYNLYADALRIREKLEQLQSEFKF